MKKLIASLFIALTLVLTVPTQSYAQAKPKERPLSLQEWWVVTFWFVSPAFFFASVLYEAYLNDWYKTHLQEQTFEDEPLDKLQR